MTILEAHELFKTVGLAKGVTIKYTADANGVLYLIGVAQGTDADPAAAVWWIIKSTLNSNGGPSQDVIYPPNQIYNSFI